ncbi:MAG: zinc ribbon domain-containing protein [Acidobacteriota bacterium]
MPIFEYSCLSCGNKFEKLVLKKGITISCPKCKSRKVEKLLSAFAFKSDKGFTSSAPSSSCNSCSLTSCDTCRR